MERIKARGRMGYGPLPGVELTRHTPYKFCGRSVLGTDRYRCGPKRPEYVWATAFSRRRANATHALQVLQASCTWPRSVSKGSPKGERTYGLRPSSRGRATAAHALQALRANCTWPRWVSIGPQKARARMGYGPLPGGELTRHTPYKFYGRSALGPDRYRRGSKRPACVWATALFQEVS